MFKNRFAVNGAGGVIARTADSKAVRFLLGAVTYAAFGFLTSRAEVLGRISPFGVAAVAAVHGGDAVFLLFGAAAGYLLPGGTGYPARYVAAAVTVFLIRWLLSGFKKFSENPVVAPACAAAALLATGMAVVLNSGAEPADIALCAAETVLGGCAAYFFRKALPFIKQPSKIWGLAQRQLIPVTITFCVLLLSLSNMGAGGLSAGRILGITAVLIAARYGRETGGAIAGAAVGSILGFGSFAMVRVLGGYGFAGLIAGIFAVFGRIGCASAFIIANGINALYLGNTQEVITGLYEVFIATVLFMLLPEKFECRFSSLFVPAGSLNSEERLRDAVHKRLSGASEALQSVSEIVTEVTSKLNRHDGGDISSVYDEVSETVCKKCGMRLFCWETAYNDTMDALNDLTPALRQNGRVEREDIPQHFAARCCRLGSFLGGVNRSYGEFAAKKSAELQVAGLRDVLAGELASMARLLDGISDGVGRIADVSYGGADRVRSALAACGVNSVNAFCLKDGDGRLTVEAEIPSESNLEFGKTLLVEQLSEAAGAPLGEPEIAYEGDRIRLRLVEKPRFVAELGQACLPKSGEALCGDTHRVYVGQDGRAVLMISDGMGCGGRAAVDSKLAVEMMERLFAAGFDYDTALNFVNSAIMMKSADESFATVDIASIDLYTGETEILKAGAPPSYLRRYGRVERIAPSSMPAGILSKVRFEHSRTALQPGDLVVVVSDGVVNGDDSWLISEIETFAGGSMDDFCREIAAKAKLIRDDGHEDDITVLAAKLKS